MTLPTVGLTAIVPCVRAQGLGQKLDDLRRLRPVLEEVLICFNGTEADEPAVSALVSASGLPACRLIRSRPFAKADALLAGAAEAANSRILYTDDDCLLWGDPNLDELARALETKDVVSFLVLRRADASARRVRAHLLRRRLQRNLVSAVGLLYLGARGGGYISGDVRGRLHPAAYQDDLFGSAEWAASEGVSVVVSSALVFQEAPRPSASYRRKLPRLMYGSFQALRISQYPRVQASIVVLKLGKYLVVGALPALVPLGLWLADQPLWLVLALVPGARTFALVWEGIVRGITDRPPTW